jgi:pyruvate dehydrogenase E1 component alpha subunit
MVTDHVAEWARPLGVPALTIDGNDVEAVEAAAREAVQRVRTTRKPFLLETYTYRLRGHMEPDDQAYVDKSELASWKQRDPIAQLEAKLLAGGATSRDELAELRARVTKQVEDAAQFAIDSPYPSFSEMTTDVYA